MEDNALLEDAENSETLCQNCHKNKAEEIRPCPFSEDVYNDPTPKCNCCAACQHECLMDI